MTECPKSIEHIMELKKKLIEQFDTLRTTILSIQLQQVDGHTHKRELTNLGMSLLCSKQKMVQIHYHLSLQEATARQMTKKEQAQIRPRGSHSNVKCLTFQHLNQCSEIIIFMYLCEHRKQIPRAIVQFYTHMSP